MFSYLKYYDIQYNSNCREAWLEKTLKQIPEGHRILDAGAGELANKKYCTHLNYVSQDFGQYDGQGDGKGLHMTTWDNSKLDLVSDIASIDVPDNSFDAILCSEVFEHIPHPIEAIKEFERILKKGGILILTAPFCSGTHFSPYHFYTGFNRYFYEKYLSDYGFEINELTLSGNYFQYIAQELYRLRFMAKKYTTTRLSFVSKILVIMMLRLLSILSKRDRGSSEFLTFGIFVVAKKK